MKKVTVSDTRYYKNTVKGLKKAGWTPEQIRVVKLQLQRLFKRGCGNLEALYPVDAFVWANTEEGINYWGYIQGIAAPIK